MDFWDRFRAKRLGRRDGRLGINLAQKRLDAILGVEETWNPEIYADQGVLLDAIQREPALDELEILSDRSRDGRERLPAPLLLIGAIFLLAVAGVANIRLMALVGEPNPDRVFFGIGLECFLVALTAGVQTAVRSRAKDWISAGVFVLYGLLVLSIGTLRASTLTVPGEGPTVIGGTAAILLIFGTAGPAWLAEEALRSLLGSASERRWMRNASRQRRRGRRRLGRSRSELARSARQRRRHREEQERLRAIYEAEFQEAQARRQLKDLTNDHHSNGGFHHDH